MKNHDDKIWEYMDIQYVIDIFEKNKGKKVYCFGAGTAAKLLLDVLPAEYKIDNFIDNNEKLWGKEFEGIKICSPDVLMEEKDYVVLIVSKHNLAIGVQLADLGLEENKDYYDIFATFFPYFSKCRIETIAKQFGRFLDRIPQDYFNKKPIKHEENICVVCILQLNKNLVNYMLAQALILRSAGYRVSIVLDSIKSYDSYCYGEGSEQMIRRYVDELVKKIREKCEDIKIYDITQEGKVSLDESDITYIERLNEKVLKWLDSRRIYGFLDGCPERNDVSRQILENALEYIKAFFNKYDFDVISVYTGIHRHRGLYRYIGQKKQIRVPTSDVSSVGKMLYNSNGVAGHADDITRLILNKCFTDKEEDILVSLAKKNFAARRNSTIKDEGYNYQIAGYEKNIKPYDIVIPLNVSWDAAALDRDRVFESDIAWLEKTLRYIIENTDATILVREHPAQNASKQYKYVKMDEKVSYIKEHEDRIFYVQASHRLNTYQYMEKCKLVLPYTSTVGVESAMMGKNVIIHTDVYYADLKIGYKAIDEADYFEKIHYYLEHPEERICTDEKNAYLAYYLQMLNPLKCDYSSWYAAWMELSMEQLMEIDGVKFIIDLVGKGVPTIYSNAKSVIEAEKDF